MTDQFVQGEVYVPGDEVTYEGTTYVAMNGTRGNVPPAWPWVPAAGDSGASGTGFKHIVKTINFDTPWTPADEERWTVTLTATGGTFTVTVDGEESGPFEVDPDPIPPGNQISNAWGNDPRFQNWTSTQDEIPGESFVLAFRSAPAIGVTVDDALATGGTVTIAKTTPGTRFAGIEVYTPTPGEYLLDAWHTGVVEFNDDEENGPYDVSSDIALEGGWYRTGSYGLWGDLGGGGPAVVFDEEAVEQGQLGNAFAGLAVHPCTRQQHRRRLARIPHHVRRPRECWVLLPRHPVRYGRPPARHTRRWQFGSLGR